MLWGLIALGSCAPARTILKQADLQPSLYAPAKLDNPQESFNALENAIYGKFVLPSIFELKTSEVVSKNWLNGKAKVERRVYEVSHGQNPQDFEIIFVTPIGNPDAPIILSQNFSANRSVIAVNGYSPLSEGKSGMGILGPVFTYFFGRYIVEPPLENIIDRGYGLVAMHPPEYIPDRAKPGTALLNDIFGADPDRPGALTLWGTLLLTNLVPRVLP